MSNLFKKRMNLEENYVDLKEIHRETDVGMKTMDILTTYSKREDFMTFINNLFNISGTLIRVIPKKYINEEICKIAVTSDFKALDYLPKEYLTQDIYDLAVKTDEKAFYKVPNNYKTEEMCKTAVSKSGNCIVSVPREHLSPELLIIALKNVTDASIEELVLIKNKVDNKEN